MTAEAILTPVITGCAVSLIVFFVTRYYSVVSGKKAAEIERREQRRAEKEQETLDILRAVAELSKATAQHKIVTIGEECLRRGSITASEKTMIDDIYQAYSADPLRGNHLAENIYERVDKLDIAPVTAGAVKKPADMHDMTGGMYLWTKPEDGGERLE